MPSGSALRAGLDHQSSSTATNSHFADLAPEIQAQMYRRLGGVALLYAGVWFANYLYFAVIVEQRLTEGPSTLWDALTGICMTFGILVWWASHRRKIPASWFMVVASGFEILGAIGIYFGMISWLDHGTMMISTIGDALGYPLQELKSGIVAPLDAKGIRLLYSEGVSWVGVWILIYPLIVPMPLRWTVMVSMLSAAVVPATLGLSALVQGVPATIEPWALPYAIETTVPTFIAAGIAIFGSRIVYRLTRDLSEAKRMGNYRLVEKIGEGGMGEVWKARHALLARPAAIKLIRTEVLGRDAQVARTALKRFEREVQLSTQLKNPHTITIYDYGQTPEGEFFYVMELLEGIDLESFVKQYGPAPAPRAMHWLHQACASLAEAHERGLIHRDVKPANLYTCRYGLQTDFLKVLDFGLVKSENVSDPGATRMTLEQGATGTPAYMPPEIALGKEADERSDVYALGCVAYWLVTGRTVFDGSTPMEVVIQHAREEPVRPSLRTELEVPDDFEAIILQCLRKDRADRPATAGQLARELAACTDFGAWTDESSRRWWDVHRAAKSRDSDALDTVTEIG
jgi:serine/threonine-protein kinase